MFTDNRKKRSIYSLSMRFSDGGAQPQADPATADGDPAPDPAPGNGDPAAGAAQAADIAAELQTLKESLEAEKQARIAAEKTRKAAEDALVSTKKELKTKERAKMTETELFDERVKELDAREADLQRRMNVTAAKGVLAGLALSDKDMTDDDLGLFVSANEERTTARCQWLKDFVQKREQAAAKSEREKVLKEFPAPAAGDASATDPFIAAFNAE